MEEKNSIDYALKSCIFIEVDDLWTTGSRLFGDAAYKTSKPEDLENRDS
jgi:hypothetical protein